MNKILLFVLLPFMVMAQNVWYVNRDASTNQETANDGKSWATAWTQLDSTDYTPKSYGVNWALIQEGDTIYVSGGTDSTCYMGVTSENITIGVSSNNYTYASGDTVIIIPAKYAPVGSTTREAASWTDHDGDVYFINNPAIYQSRIMYVMHRSNIKLYGFKFWETRPVRWTYASMVSLGDGDTGDVDSMITVENCLFYGKGLSGFLVLQGTKNGVENNIFYHEPNRYPIGQDAMGINIGRGGHTINGNSFIMGVGFTDTSITGSAAVTITATSLTDTRLNRTINEDVGGYCLIGTVSLTIDSNTATTFYGAQWDSFYVGEKYTGATPPNGSSYAIMTDAHTDGIQYSNFGFGETLGGFYATERLTMTFSNNLVIDQVEGGTSLNGLLYSSGPYCNQTFLVYNNIFVNKKTKENYTNVWIGKGGIAPWTSYDNSLYFVNNTIINKGVGDAYFFNAYNHDTLIVKNNLFIGDTLQGLFMNLDGGDGFPNCYKEIDYNYYAEQGGIEGTFALDNGEYWTIGGANDWLTDLTFPNDSVPDAHSTFANSTGITWSDKYDTTANGYYTTTGRDAGVDLGSIYPYLQYDILGNERTGTWDIGALEYNGSTDTIPTFSFTPVTGATRGQTYTATSVFTNVDSTFHVSTTTGAQFKIGALGSYGTTMVEADSGDTVYVQTIASGSYSTMTSETIKAGGNDQVFTVTTESQPIVPPVTGGNTLRSNGILIKDANGIIIRTAE